jgi:hypothetical protein
MAFPWKASVGRQAGLLRNFWQEPFAGPIYAEMARFGDDKNRKSRSLALSKAALHWYIPLAPKGIRQGMPSQEASG